MYAQTGPENQPLYIASSTDGINFGSPTTFLDSAGVVSLLHWKSDTLVATFQWFKEPKQSLTWDRVAVKFSYDNGVNWTDASPIVVNGLGNFQRPFDPTLTISDDGDLRLFFSSSVSNHPSTSDSINCFSATSTDGINYTLESGARVEDYSVKLIDPAVAKFKNKWHYAAPIAYPGYNAYHYTSTDGVVFTKEPDIALDSNHNWTGNLMLESANEMRFYGTGRKGFPNIWYASTMDGDTWNYTNTSIMMGGDPSCIKISSTNYLMIYTGPPYTTDMPESTKFGSNRVTIVPNPVQNQLNIHFNIDFGYSDVFIYSITGSLVKRLSLSKTPSYSLDVSDLYNGVYFIRIEGNQIPLYKKFVIAK